MLETTQYNYKELAKMYKEQVQLGYSKMLTSNCYGSFLEFYFEYCLFENEVMNLRIDDSTFNVFYFNEYARI